MDKNKTDRLHLTAQIFSHVYRSEEFSEFESKVLEFLRRYHSQDYLDFLVVFDMLSAGDVTNKDIADRLYISHETARQMMAVIRRGIPEIERYQSGKCKVYRKLAIGGAMRKLINKEKRQQ